MTLRGGSYTTAKIKDHMRSNIFLAASVVATIALLAVIMPFSLSLQDTKAQALVQPNTTIVNHNSMTSPQHDMTMMVMGQDSMMNSYQSSRSQDNSIPNKP